MKSALEPGEPVGDEPPPRGRLRRLLNPHGWGTRRLVLMHVLCLALAILTVDQLAHFLYWPAADAKEILLVGSPSCPHSRAVRSRLETQGIPFREIDARNDPLASALAAWAFQSLRVPIVVVGPEVIHGNRAARIDTALAQLGYSPPTPPPTSAPTPTPRP